MIRGSARVAALLFFSGACALAYQTTWLRQFRLVFGASTSATAAVLAIFMGGLGAGSAILGKRADTHPRPLAMYGKLELMIAASAFLSQPLLHLISTIYLALGGSVVLGSFGATIVRLVLATLILGLPTFLMGGTLPAAARAIETTDDPSRRRVSILYATNTLGAVTGTLIATFWMIEHLGNRMTLFVAVIVNAIVGAVALLVTPSVSEGAGGMGGDANAATPPGPLADARGDMSPTFVLISSAIVGFAFLLMELVWYRMLAPILGGTTFMFGLILATALLGIGLGGLAYSSWRGTPTAGAFAITCSAEALAMIIPYALGDRLAVIAHFLRPLGRIGFEGNLISWALMTFVIVFPAAFIAGIQFPLLIALLGRGREDVGRHVGLAYAWNTGGAIAGSLAGGFGLIPLFSAPGTWKVVVLALAALGAVTIMVSLRQRQIISSVVAGVVAILAVGCTLALGPTSVWRHSGIGAGRAPELETRNSLRAWINDRRRILLWDADGRESSVALLDADDVGFYVNGKSDGSARIDAGTQVMSGVLGAFLHPNPHNALVIGLGTGSSAGWLAAIPSISRVDAIEIEPVVLDVARQLSAVNHDAMRNPKLHMHIADAREVLLTTRDRYDVIFSEPSNPYRAGVANLFTREYYEAVNRRLAPGGVLVQWVQAYDVDAATIATIYKTLLSVFPHVETWRGEPDDLLLVARREPPVYDADAMRARLAQPVYREAAHAAWRAEDLEAFLGHVIAPGDFAKAVARGEINTDDRTVVEFGFARTLGEAQRFSMTSLIAAADAMHLKRVDVRGAVDWNRVSRNREIQMEVVHPPGGNAAAAINSGELALIADQLARDGDPNAPAAIVRLPRIEADALRGVWSLRTKQYDQAAAALERAFIGYRSSPWPLPAVMVHALDATSDLARADRRYAERMYRALEEPFAAGQLEDDRKVHRVLIAVEATGCSPMTVNALRALEPWTVWNEVNLRIRRDCYARAGLVDLARDAARDYAEFVKNEPAPLTR